DASKVRSSLSLGRTRERLLQNRNVELLHLQHRLQRRRRVARFSVRQHLHERVRHDLPRDAESVFEPTALALFPAALDQLAPVAVDLLLRLAVDHQGDALLEFEGRAGVEREEFSAVELERRAEHLALISAL